ncbi:MAG: FecR domain-containing protein [Myxococcota bacterium]
MSSRRWISEGSEGSGRDLRSYVPVGLSQDRLDRQWLAIALALPDAPRSSERRGREWAAFLGSVAVAGLLVILGTNVFVQGPDRSNEAGWPVGERVAPEDSVQRSLEDGSRVLVTAGARVRRTPSPSGIALTVERGRVAFVVVHQARDPFRVFAGDVEVRVVGTRFEVAHVESEVSVRVDEGVVEVSTPAQSPFQLRAQESWTGSTNLGIRAPPISGGSSTSRASSSASEPRLRVPSPKRAPRRASSSRRPLPKSTGTSATPPAKGESESMESLDDGATGHVRRTGGRPLDVPGASDERVSPETLFLQARRYRLRGEARRAAASLQEFLREYPSDARAGLAAFELGKLRMDRFSELRGALDAFERSLRTQHEVFREDALARIVIILGRLGDSSCSQRQRVYLQTYPDGARVPEVRSACP